EIPKLTTQGWVSSLDVSPDGKTLAVGLSFGQMVELRALPDGQPYTTLKTQSSGWTAPPAFRPDSTTLATTAGPTIELWDVKTGQLKATHPEHVPFAGPTFSPDGSKLVFGTRDHSFLIWDPAKSTTSSLLLGHDDITRQIAWNPRGDQLASS